MVDIEVLLVLLFYFISIYYLLCFDAIDQWRCHEFQAVC